MSEALKGARARYTNALLNALTRTRADDLQELAAAARDLSRIEREEGVRWTPLSSPGS